MKDKKMKGVNQGLGVCQVCSIAFAFGGQLNGKWMCENCANEWLAK
jgi:hypothetical protein